MSTPPSAIRLLATAALALAVVATAVSGCATRSAVDHHGMPERVQAEAGRLSGGATVRGPGTRLHTPEAEASGRRCVELPPAAAVDLTTPIHADSLVLRASYPDAPGGGGLDGDLELCIGDAVHRLPVTSRFSAVYGRGRFNTADVWPEDPAEGLPRRFWAEAGMRLPEMPAGAVIRVRNPHAQRTVLIDFAEFELLPPAVPAPSGALSFADWRPDATGAAECTALLQQAVDEALRQGRPLHVPEGVYRIGVVQVPGIRLQGAGLWRTRFTGPRSRFHFTSGTVAVADLAVFGETTGRDDRSDDGNAFTGVPGPGSRFARIWVERKKCAWWVAPAPDGRTVEDLTISAWRIRDVSADGINLYNGARRCAVEDCAVRNSGDDGLASWSPAARGRPSGDIAFRRNRVELPWLASGIAVYGGGPFTIAGNEVADTLTSGSGIFISASFKAWPFAGEVRVADNLLLRCGAHESDPGGPTGAIRLLALDADMTAASFVLERNRVVEPLASAVSLQGPHRIANLTVAGLVLEDAGTAALLDVRPRAAGEASFTGTACPPGAAWRIAPGADFTIRREQDGRIEDLAAPP